MFLFLMIALIMSLPTSSEQQDGNFNSHSKPAANETDVAVNLVAEILENVVFLNISDYLPTNYVYMEKDDVQDKVDTSDKSDEDDTKSSDKIITFDDDEEIHQINKSSTVENLEERKPIRRFTSRPFEPTKSIKVVAGTHPAASGQLHTKGNISVAGKPKRRLTSRVITSRPLRSRPLTSAPRTSPYQPITTTPATTSTTPGVCQAFCSLSGKIAIKSGLLWREELLHSFTKYYKEVTAEIVSNVSKVFRDTFGNSFEFASVEEYSAVGEIILVHFFVQFDGYTISNVTTTALKDAFQENLRKVGADEFKLGEFLIDMSATEFRVVDTSQPLELVTPGDDSLPDWAWLAMLGGTLSTIIIAIIGTMACVQIYRRDSVVKRRVINQRLVETLHGEKKFGRGGIGTNKDKRDMWAVQRELQAVIGMRTGGGGHDDSSAGLMAGLNNTWLHDTSRHEAENGPEEEVIVDRSVFSRNNKLRMTGGDILL